MNRHVLLDTGCRYSGVPKISGVKIGPVQRNTELMEKTGEPTNPRERKYRRFNLRYPVHVKFETSSTVLELDTVSRNVSLGGMLLESPAAIPQRSPVSFVMTLQAERMLHPVELQGEGEVVRVESGRGGSGYSVAVECSRPIAQIERYLPTAV